MAEYDKRKARKRLQYIIQNQVSTLQIGSSIRELFSINLKSLEYLIKIFLYKLRMLFIDKKSNTKQKLFQLSLTENWKFPEFCVGSVPPKAQWFSMEQNHILSSEKYCDVRIIEWKCYLLISFKFYRIPSAQGYYFRLKKHCA